jgi:hypothetical protein
MAVTPNDNFTAGQVLTATECNNFPRGLMTAPVSTSTTDAAITAEEIQLEITWTAVANRNYRIIYTEPQLSGTVVTTCTARLRTDNVTGTVVNSNTIGISNTSLPFNSICQAVGTYGAGSQKIVATLEYSAGTGTATRSATRLALLTVEDLGTA